MRICAQAHCGTGDELKREFSPEEGMYYNKVPCLLSRRTSSTHASLIYLGRCATKIL